MFSRIATFVFFLKYRLSAAVLLLMLFINPAQASLSSDSSASSFSQSAHKISFLEYPSWPVKNRCLAAGIGIPAFYGGVLTGLNYIWYANYPRSRFRFFNDGKEWNQIDKMGHIQTAYFESVFAYHIFRWAGLNNTQSAILGGFTGWTLQSSIEILDGFSAGWGASGWDIAANTFGAALATTQFLLWKEQRISLKYSYHLFPYPSGQLNDRANDLYGSGPLERLLKDYNNANYWVSVNLASFNKKQKHLKWLNIAIGFGAGNMYGGFENRWTSPGGRQIDRTDIPRYRKFFISLDADLSKIKVNSRAGRMALGILNILKLPAPAIEFNTLGQVVFHPIHFLNLSMPVYFRK